MFPAPKARAGRARSRTTTIRPSKSGGGCLRSDMARPGCVASAGFGSAVRAAVEVLLSGQSGERGIYIRVSLSAEAVLCCVYVHKKWGRARGRVFELTGRDSKAKMAWCATKTGTAKKQSVKDRKGAPSKQTEKRKRSGWLRSAHSSPSSDAPRAKTSWRRAQWRGRGGAASPRGVQQLRPMAAKNTE